MYHVYLRVVSSPLTFYRSKRRSRGSSSSERYTTLFEHTCLKRSRVLALDQSVDNDGDDVAGTLLYTHTCIIIVVLQPSDDSSRRFCLLITIAFAVEHDDGGWGGTGASARTAVTKGGREGREDGTRIRGTWRGE